MNLRQPAPETLDGLSDELLHRAIDAYDDARDDYGHSPSDGLKAMRQVLAPAFAALRQQVDALTERDN